MPHLTDGQRSMNNFPRPAFFQCRPDVRSRTGGLPGKSLQRTALRGGARYNNGSSRFRVGHLSFVPGRPGVPGQVLRPTMAAICSVKCLLSETNRVLVASRGCCRGIQRNRIGEAIPIPSSARFVPC
jgi:hypothetical protein